jgi:hypothetical protein
MLSRLSLAERTQSIAIRDELSGGDAGGNIGMLPGQVEREGDREGSDRPDRGEKAGRGDRMAHIQRVFPCEMR